MDMTPPFQRVLVANRGEIAVRVIRACQELGIRASAVYSEADLGALHTRLADEAHLLGPASPADSYLNIERILKVASQAGAEAIHPGYGFLSENADFAEACAAAGFTFIGPPPSAMRLVGDKAAARHLAARQGVPIVPGYDGKEQDTKTLAAQAAAIGFPLLIKAARGGGGRGMRLVRSSSAFPEELESAQREAQAAFGDAAVILERFVSPARHVEVQIVGDQHGALIHLAERDCSVQRRHQKVVEESPSPAVTEKLRAELGAAAVSAARAARYSSVGTSEFLLDAENHFYFIEMNARLQVEHTVTEQVTGLDLVKLQMEIAAGRELPLEQKSVALRGHALECRLYAEDPARGLLPAAGRLEQFVPPLGPGLRHDVGFASGDTVNTHYDAMLGKLIAYGEDRAAAVARARWALDHYVVSGVPTNLPLLSWVLAHPIFSRGEATTEFLTDEWHPALPQAAGPPEALAAACAFELSARSREPTSDPWSSLGPWRLLDEGIVMTYEVEGQPRTCTVSRQGSTTHDAWLISVDDEPYGARVRPNGDVTVEQGGQQRELRVSREGPDVLVSDRGLTYLVRRAAPPNIDAAPSGVSGARSASRLVAPMPGRIVKVAVQPGQRVHEHEPLVVLEAMKIEHTVAAPNAGVVAVIHCEPGQTVDGGVPLLDLDLP